MQYPSWVRSLFRLKVSPQILLREKDPKIFSKIVSQINVGWTFKTVKAERHSLADQIIGDLIKKKQWKISMCDIGCSDGSSSLKLFEKFKDKFENYDLFDHDSKIYFNKTKSTTTYFNREKIIIYIQYGPLLIYLYPQQRKIQHTQKAQEISFSNPSTQMLWLIINEFDVFKDIPHQKYDLIKCANLLHTGYFTKEKIGVALNNMKKYLKIGGLLVLIHNNNKYKKGEAVLVLEKNTNNKRNMKQNIDNHEIVY